MKVNPFLFVLSLALLTPTGSAHAQQSSAVQVGTGTERPLVMITFFDPFDGSTVNNSKFVAEGLKIKLKESYDIELCNIPVIYDHEFDVAKECIKNLSRAPHLIISMGEGGPCTQVSLETLTQNLDSTDMADNANVTHLDQTIIPGEPRSKAISFLDSDIQGILQDIPEIQLSHDMGNYVCNNIAFHMVTYLESLAAPKISYTFIHVPSNQCDDGLSVDGASTAIAKLLSSPAAIALTAGTAK